MLNSVSNLTKRIENEHYQAYLTILTRITEYQNYTLDKLNIDQIMGELNIPEDKAKKMMQGSRLVPMKLYTKVINYLENLSSDNYYQKIISDDKRYCRKHHLLDI